MHDVMFESHDLRTHDKTPESIEYLRGPSTAGSTTSICDDAFATHAQCLSLDHDVHTDFARCISSKRKNCTGA